MRSRSSIVKEFKTEKSLYAYLAKWAVPQMKPADHAAVAEKLVQAVSNQRTSQRGVPLWLFQRVTFIRRELERTNRLSYRPSKGWGLRTTMDTLLKLSQRARDAYLVK